LLLLLQSHCGVSSSIPHLLLWQGECLAGPYIPGGGGGGGVRGWGGAEREGFVFWGINSMLLLSGFQVQLGFLLQWKETDFLRRGFFFFCVKR